MTAQPTGRGDSERCPSSPDPPKMKIGMELPIAERRGRPDIPRWSDIKHMAQRAEAVGFDSVWVEDHLLVRHGADEPHGLWDCWSIVAGLAAVTSRVEIGTFVACAGFRNPAL